MAKATQTSRTCANGHYLQKTSDCPTCPACEAEKKPLHGFLSELSAPGRRALEGDGITTLAKLAQHTEKEILALHGIGPSTIPILKKALADAKFTFRTK